MYKNHVLRKKTSDFVITRLIPDFYAEIPYKWKYSPYSFTSRVTYSIIAGYIIYRISLSRFSEDTNSVKKYSFNIFSKAYLDYEAAMIKKEKISGNRILL